MRFVKLTELYMEKGTRERREGEGQYADRDTYSPRLTSVWVNLAQIIDMRPRDNSEYAEKNPERYPNGYPATTQLCAEHCSYTVTETVEEILATSSQDQGEKNGFSAQNARQGRDEALALSPGDPHD